MAIDVDRKATSQDIMRGYLAKLDVNRTVADIMRDRAPQDVLGREFDVLGRENDVLGGEFGLVNARSGSDRVLVFVTGSDSPTPRPRPAVTYGDQSLAVS